MTHDVCVCMRERESQVGKLCSREGFPNAVSLARCMLGIPPVLNVIPSYPRAICISLYAYTAPRDLPDHDPENSAIGLRHVHIQVEWMCVGLQRGEREKHTVKYQDILLQFVAEKREHSLRHYVRGGCREDGERTEERSEIGKCPSQNKKQSEKKTLAYMGISSRPHPLSRWKDPMCT